MCPSTAGEPLATRSMPRSWPKATTPSATRSSSTTAGGLDASLLLIPISGFLPADDPRVLGTIDAIQQEICEGPFVWRYSTEDGVDGLAGGEGAFLICSFWLVSALATAGRVEEAERNLEQLTALRNDVGLLSEEYDPKSKRLLGNFPQAFSHRTVARHLRDQRSTPVGHIRPPARPADGSRGVPRLGPPLWQRRGPAWHRSGSDA